MANATRDKNRVTVLMLQDASTGVPVPALADHATGYLLVAVANGSGPVVLNGNAPRDANRVPAAMVENSSGVAVPLLANSDGYAHITTS